MVGEAGYWQNIGLLLGFAAIVGMAVYHTHLTPIDSSVRNGCVLKAVQVFMSAFALVYLIGSFTWISPYLLNKLHQGRAIVSVVDYTLLSIYSLAFIGLQVGRSSAELCRSLKKLVLGLTMSIIVVMVILLFVYLWIE